MKMLLFIFYDLTFLSLIKSNHESMYIFFVQFYSPENSQFASEKCWEDDPFLFRSGSSSVPILNLEGVTII